MLIIKGPGMGHLPLTLRSDPTQDKVVYASIVNNGLQVSLDVVSSLVIFFDRSSLIYPSKSNCVVDVYMDHPLKDLFTCPFWLTFLNEVDFWRFCGAFGDAKVVQICCAEKLLEASEEAVNRVVKQLKVQSEMA